MTRDKLYMRRISGTDAHEVVALVPAEAVEKARQAREDAPRWRLRLEADRKAAAEHRARSRALWEAAEAWRLDRLKEAEEKLGRMGDMLARLQARGGRAGW